MFEKSIKLIDIQTIVVSLIILAVCLLRVAPHINNFSPIIALAIFGSLHFKNKTQAYVVPILCLWISDYFINNCWTECKYNGYFNCICWSINYNGYDKLILIHHCKEVHDKLSEC